MPALLLTLGTDDVFTPALTTQAMAQAAGLPVGGIPHVRIPADRAVPPSVEALPISGNVRMVDGRAVGHGDGAPSRPRRPLRGGRRGVAVGPALPASRPRRRGASHRVTHPRCRPNKRPSGRNSLLAPRLHLHLVLVSLRRQVVRRPRGGRWADLRRRPRFPGHTKARLQAALQPYPHMAAVQLSPEHGLRRLQDPSLVLTQNFRK